MTKPSPMNWNELLHSIADRRDDGTRYAFLLVAGASISSGIPGANKLARGARVEAEPFLERAEKNADNKGLELELHLCRGTARACDKDQ